MSGVHNHFLDKASCFKVTCEFNERIGDVFCEYIFLSRDDEVIYLCLDHMPPGLWQVGDTFDLHLMPLNVPDTECHFIAIDDVVERAS